MPYADSDFFIALIKEDDWLCKKAEQLLEYYKGKIWTSHWVLVELLMLSNEYGMDPETIVTSISQLARVEGGVAPILAAAHLMKDRDMATFDALHAISCGDDFIISSDSVFDKLGIKRIKLE